MADESFNFDGPKYLDMQEILKKTEDIEKIESYFEVDHDNDSALFFSSLEQQEHEHTMTSSTLKKEPLLESTQETREDESINQSQMSVVQSIEHKNVPRFNELSKPKPTTTKFTSMKESATNFQVKTPQRFRTQPMRQKLMLQPKFAHFQATIPHSPHLATKTRSRPVNALSASEREDILVAEMQKFKLKAQPVNKKVLQPVKPIQLIAKPGTMAITPFVLKRFAGRRRSKSAENVSVTATTTLKTTKTQPFSFEERDRFKVAMKDTKIKQQFLEEKRARQFKAQPMPKYLNSEPSIPVKQITRGLGSLESLRMNKDKETIKFTAKPAVSLSIAPFVPKPSNKPKTQIECFSLKSDERVRERRYYNEKVNEKIEKKREESLLRAIEQNSQQFKAERKLTIHKAQPIKKYKPMVAIAPRSATVPITPQLLRTKSQHNKEN